MKLMWTLSIAWSLCYTASALTCRNCTNTACTTTAQQTCGANQRCITATLNSSAATGSLVFKGCVAESVCLTTGTVTISANLGGGTGTAKAQCCNTDDCNTATLTVATETSANELKCFTCGGMSATTCNTSLTCVGTQDRCVNGTAERKSFGCVSSNFCGASAQLSVFSPLSNLASFTEGPKCCDTNFCNSASTLSLGLAVPLALWVVTVTLTP